MNPFHQTTHLANPIRTGFMLLCVLVAMVRGDALLGQELYDEGLYRLSYHCYQTDHAGTSSSEDAPISLMGGARALEATGSYEQAKRDFQLLTTRYPDSQFDGDASLGISLCALHLGDSKTAGTWAFRAESRAVNPDTIDEASFIRCELDFQNEVNNCGLEGYADLARRLPKGLKRQISAYTAGWLSLGTKDYHIAHFYLLMAAQGEDPKLTSLAQVALERVYLELGNDEAALEAIEAAGYELECLKSYSLYRQGLLLLKTGKLLQAITKLEDATRSNPYFPNSDKAIYLIGNAYSRLGNNQASIDAFQRLVDLYPSSDYVRKALWQQGFLLFRAHKYSRALGIFSQLAESPSEDGLTSSSVYYQALCLRKLQRTTSARNAFHKALSLLPPENPCYEAAAYMRAEMALAGGEFELALDYNNWYLNQTAFKTYRDLATIDMGECLLRIKKHFDALSIFTNFPLDFPYSQMVPRSFWLAGQTMEEMKKRREAIGVYQSLINKYPRSRSAALASLRLGQIYYEEEAYETARQIYANYLMQFPKHESSDEASFGICRSDYALKRFEDALAGYEKFVTDYPNSRFLDDARYGIELSLLHLGHYSNPVEATDAFLVKYPKSHLAPELIFWIAEYRRQNREYREAEIQYRKVINDFPTDETTARAKLSLGIMLRDLSRPEEALEMFNSVAHIQGNPYTPEALYQAAELCISLNRINEALLDLVSASRAYPESPYAPRAQLRIGSLYHQLSMKLEARTSYMEVIDRFPKSAEADRAWLNVGQILIEEGRYLDSLGYLEHAITSTDNEIASLAMFKKTVALHLAGREQEAEKASEELDRRFPGARARLGEQ